ncbi:MAG: ribonuclease H-like YkuK family protein [Candidatus Bipolaricaulaceae bacterium]
MDDGRPFHNPTLGPLSFTQVVDEMVAMMGADPKAEYQVIVGADSQAYHDAAEYVLAIVVHRVGKGGRYFWRRTRERRPQSLRERIYREAWLSYEAAQQLIEALRARKVLGFHLEIHVDVGRAGRTRELVEEVVGMIIGVGFPVRTKPEAYAASTVADKHT